jgi:hypothetical protein
MPSMMETSHKQCLTATTWAHVELRCLSCNATDAQGDILKQTTTTHKANVYAYIIRIYIMYHTSVLCGSHTMQPFVLQNCCNLNMASWKDGACAEREPCCGGANCVGDASAEVAELHAEDRHDTASSSLAAIGLTDWCLASERGRHQCVGKNRPFIIRGSRTRARLAQQLESATYLAAILLQCYNYRNATNRIPFGEKCTTMHALHIGQARSQKLRRPREAMVSPEFSTAVHQACESAPLQSFAERVRLSNTLGCKDLECIFYHAPVKSTPSRDGP